MSRYLSRCILVIIFIISIIVTNVGIGAAESYAESFRFPLDGSWIVTQDFNVYNSVFDAYHLGEDVLRSSEVPVYAPANGIVKHNIKKSSYGYVVIIEHHLTDNSYVCSVHGHLRVEGLASIGSEVTKGQIIGYLSSDYYENGGYDFTHIHFGIRKGIYSSTWVYWGYGSSSEGNNWYDPSDFINSHQFSTTPIPLSGDLNDDGTDSYGTFDPSTAGFTFNGKTVNFGASTDLPVMGDWDHDGKDEIGVYRPDAGGGQSKFYLITRDWSSLSGPAGDADKTISFGPYPNNIPIAGDWDGDGDDDIGGFYPDNNNFYLYILDLPSSSADPYAPHPSVQFGTTDDTPIIGDWDGDDDDDVGVFRPGATTNNFYLDLELTGGQHELGPYEFGDVGDKPVPGDWDGDGDDNIGVYRPSTDQFYIDSNIPPNPMPLNVVISESPDPVTSEETSQVTVHVSTTGSTSVSGASISISATGGSLSPISGTTDANGNFKPTYTAPTVSTTQTYTISATASKTGYTSGSGSDTITINPKPLYVIVSELPDPVTSEETSQVTVHVSTTGSTPVSGASISISATGGSLSPTSGTTDANGDFKPTYTAPTVSTTEEYTISATASKAGYTSGSGSDIITVDPPVAQPLNIEITESPDPVISEETSQVTIHVSTTGNIPVSGATVSVSSTGGSLNPTSGTTDANGDFKPTYTAPTVSTTEEYTISATASKTGYTSGSGSDTITVDPPVAQPLNIEITESPDPVTSEETSQVTIHVTTTGDTPVSGATVSVSSTGGFLNPTSGTTDANGDFTPTYTAPTVSTTQTYIISATASKAGYTGGSGSDTITVLPSSCTPPNIAWNVTISATNQLEPVVIGMHPSAADGYDTQFDLFAQTPAQGKVILILDDIFSTSIKKTRCYNESVSWIMSVGVPSGQTTTLSWNVPNYLNLTILEGANILPSGSQLNEGSHELIVTAKLLEFQEFDMNLKAGWNMVSVPLIMDNNSVHAVFSDIPTLDTMPVKTWQSPIFIDVTEIYPKVGYWVFTPTNTVINVKGTPIHNTTLYLQAGWNIVGTVGLHDLTLSDIPNQVSERPAVIWVPPTFENTNVIESGKSAWVFVTSGTVVPFTSGKGVVSSELNAKAMPMMTEIGSALVASATEEWNLTISATNQLEPVTTGIHPGATNGYDGYDVFSQTPVQGKVIMVLDNIYATEINRDELIWYLDVGVPAGQTTTLIWDSSKIPVDVTLLLDETDMKLQTSIELGEGAHSFVINGSITKIPGDLNGDNQITSADIRIALEIAFSGEYISEADMDENGYVNVIDARMIMQAAAGRIEL